MTDTPPPARREQDAPTLTSTQERLAEIHPEMRASELDEAAARFKEYARLLAEIMRRGRLD